ITPVPAGRKLIENEIIHEAWLAPKIAVIDIEGILVNEAGPPLLTDGEHAVSLLVEKLDRAAHDRSVKAVLLRINSPGGTVAASELMHYEITRFRKRTGKVVIAVMMDVAASGGYYVACACDEIMAHRSTVTGSIGVVLQLFDLTGTMAKLGVRPHTIKSGDLKAGGSPFETLSEKDREIFQRIIDDMHQAFVEVVAAGRPGLTEEHVRKLADGRVYTASQALEAGLIDRIGTMRDAIEVAKKKIHAQKVNVVVYHRPLRYVPNYYARAAVGGDINVFKIEWPAWLRRPTARFMYLWVP
ncbi:MAG: signal peptide peptidase SppA, partial [Phycisphaerae bacterium]